MDRHIDLSEREREVLALLMQGHETKSIAATLGLSVHAVNERLREARRKLGASSSREAARRYFENGTPPPQISRDRKIGIGGAGAAGLTVARPGGGIAPNRMILVLLGVALMLSILALAAAQSSASPSARSSEPTVTATTPVTGDKIAPGPFTLSVTFDRPMHDQSYSFVQISAESYPHCESRPQFSADRRTYSLRCTAEAGRRYEVWFNREPYMAFRGEDGTPSRPYRLLFGVRK